MSNYLAVATVTAALGQLAHAAAETAVSGVGLRFGRPTPPSGDVERKKLHIYLYQVTPNPALRNNDLPTRDSEGRLAQRPRAALDLHYLLTFYGDDQALEPDRMLGAVARDLHARPVLSSQAIQNAIASRSELSGSNLASAVESVKFTPTSLSLDDLSRLWSVMVQTPHALSMTYQGTVVLIDAEESAGGALPVLKRGESDRGVDTQVGPFPQLNGYWAGAAAAAARRPRPPSFPAAQLGTRLRIAGANLGGDSVRIHFSHPDLSAAQEIALPPDDRDASELRLALPDDAAAQDAWAAGVYRVVTRVERGDLEHSSNVLPVALAPRVTAIQPNPASGAGGTVTLTVTCRPKVLPAQSATLLLEDREVAAQPRSAPSALLVFDVESAPVVSGIPIRVRIDGIDSLPVVYDAVTGEFVFDDSQRVTIT